MKNIYCQNNPCSNLYPPTFQSGNCAGLWGDAGVRGATGPTGPAGPTGPTGPAGTPGILSTVFLTAPNAVNVQPTLLLENAYPTTQTDISVAGENNVNIAPGTYLMRFGSTVTSTNGTPPTISLSVNNVVESGTIRTGVAFGSASITGDALLTIPTQSILSFDVTLAPELAYDENFLIISRLG